MKPLWKFVPTASRRHLCLRRPRRKGRKIHSRELPSAPNHSSTRSSIALPRARQPTSRRPPPLPHPANIPPSLPRRQHPRQRRNHRRRFQWHRLRPVPVPQPARIPTARHPQVGALLKFLPLASGRRLYSRPRRSREEPARHFPIPTQAIPRIPLPNHRRRVSVAQALLPVRTHHLARVSKSPLRTSHPSTTTSKTTAPASSSSRLPNKMPRTTPRKSAPSRANATTPSPPQKAAASGSA